MRAANTLQIICHQRKNANNSSHHLMTTLGAHCPVPSFNSSSGRFFIMSHITLNNFTGGKGNLGEFKLSCSKLYS